MRSDSQRSLLKVLIALAIICTVTVILVPKASQSLATARQGRTITRLNAIRANAHLYYMDHSDTRQTHLMGPYPWDITQLVSGCGDPVCAARGVSHRYMVADGEGAYVMPAEEVGLDFAQSQHQAGDQTTNYCDAGHSFCGGGVAAARQVEPAPRRGGWNWCSPPIGKANMTPLTGSFWIDENVLLFNGVPSYEQ